MIRVVTKIGRIRNSAEQPVNRRRVRRHQRFDLLRTIEGSLGILDGLLHSRSRFPAGRGERNTKSFTAWLFQQEPENGSHSSRLTSARSSGYHAEIVHDRCEGGHLLPIDLSIG